MPLLFAFGDQAAVLPVAPPHL